MTLFIFGLFCGTVFGFWCGLSCVRKQSLSSAPPRRTRAMPGNDAVSNYINEMKNGVQLLAEDQRNRNFRAALEIKSDRQKLAREYRARNFN